MEELERRKTWQPRARSLQHSVTRVRVQGSLVTSPEGVDDSNVARDCSGVRGTRETTLMRNESVTRRKKKKEDGGERRE